MNILLFLAEEPIPESAVALAGYIARLTSSAVTLLFVNPGEPDTAAETRSLAKVMESLPGVEVDVHLYHGRATGHLLDEAREETYDLVVMAMRQIGHLRRRLTGSRSRSVLRRGRPSVLIAKRNDSRLERILICTSGTEIAEKVVEAGARLAQLAQAQVTLLHVATAFPKMYAGLPKIQESLDELLNSETPVAQHLRQAEKILRDHALSPRLALRRGVVVEEILQESVEGDYDLVVLGATAPAGQLQAWLLGEVAWEVVERAECHVLVVKHAEPVFVEAGE